MSDSAYPTGTIVLIKFPFAEASSHKIRPAIVVNTDLPQSLLVLYITSNTDIHSSYDVQLEPSTTNNLQKTSTARTNRLTVASVEDIVRQLGQLDEVEHRQIKNALQKVVQDF